MSGKRAVLFAPVMPEPDREGGSLRLWNFIAQLEGDGWDVTVMVSAPTGGDLTRRTLNQRGIPVYRGFDVRVAEAITHGRFDLAIVAFWYVAEEIVPLIRAASPSTRIVLDTIDLHFLRHVRQAAGDISGIGRVTPAVGDELVREINACLMVDRVLTVSDKEAGILGDLTGRPGIALTVPDMEAMEPSPFGWEERSSMLFLGNFRHPPNPEALKWLCGDILPLVAPEVRRANPLRVVGNALDLRHRGLVGDLEDVTLVGWIPSVLPELERARLMVAPLRHGAGTKRKIVQAMMSGTPVVTTSVGAEGLPVRDGEGVLVRDDAASFAAAVERVATDRAYWESLVRGGRERITAVHGAAAASAAFRQAIEQVLAQPAHVIPATDDVPQAAGGGGRSRISASKEAVVGWPEPGTVEIAWRGATKQARVTVAEPGHSERLFATGRKGHQPAAWIRAGRSYTFRLYDGPGAAAPAAIVQVRGIAPGSKASRHGD